MPDEPRRLLFGLRFGQQFEPVLGGEIVELVGGAARFDQVRRDHRVVGSRDAQCLGIVSDELAFQSFGPRSDHDFLLGRERGALGISGESPRAG